MADEPAHFYRAFQVSEFGWIASRLETEAVGGMLPRGLLQTTNRLLGAVPLRSDQPITPSAVAEELRRPFDAADRVPVAFQNTALYSPLAYLPQAVGIRLARLYSLASPVVLLYGARAFNLAVWIFLCYWAIKITPIAKWAFFLLALAPMAVFQGASASGDAMAMGLTFLAAAWWLRILEQTRPVWIWELALLGVLTAGLALLKPPYMIMGVLFAAIPSNKFVSRRQRRRFILILTVVAAFLATAWILIAHGLYLPSHPGTPVNPAAQLYHIVQDPTHYLRAVLVSHFTTASDQLLVEFVGVLGWLDTPIPLWTVGLYYSLFLLALSPPQPAVVPSRPQRLLALGLWLIAVQVIDVLLYLTWTRVGNVTIQGLQGRYYLPLAPLIVIAGYGLVRTEQKLTTRRYTLMVGSFVVLATAVLFELFRYYPISLT